MTSEKSNLPMMTHGVCQDEISAYEASYHHFGEYPFITTLQARDLDILLPMPPLPVISRRLFLQAPLAYGSSGITAASQPVCHCLQYARISDSS